MTGFRQLSFDFINTTKFKDFMQAFLTTVMGWGPNWSPRDWNLCNGALLAISQFTAIFSLIGTIYGGDGRTTFMLPDLRGRALIGSGAAPGMQPYVIGYRGGQEFVTLNIPEMPAHNHTAALSGGTAAIDISPYTNSAVGTDVIPTGNYPAQTAKVGKATVPGYATSRSGTDRMAPMIESAALSGTVSVGITGNSSSHENRTPYQVLNWIFCMQGTYPSRN